MVVDLRQHFPVGSAPAKCWSKQGSKHNPRAPNHKNLNGSLSPGLSFIGSPFQSKMTSAAALSSITVSSGVANDELDPAPTVAGESRTDGA